MAPPWIVPPEKEEPELDEGQGDRMSGMPGYGEDRGSAGLGHQTSGISNQGSTQAKGQRPNSEMQVQFDTSGPRLSTFKATKNKLASWRMSFGGSRPQALERTSKTPMPTDLNWNADADLSKRVHAHHDAVSVYRTALMLHTHPLCLKPFFAGHRARRAGPCCSWASTA